MEVSFESSMTMTQQTFAQWVKERSGWDANHYELLNGRVVMNPPAGFPHGSIGHELQVLLGVFVKAGRLGRVFDSSQGFELPSGDSVEPDHSFVSTERWKAAPPPEEGSFLRVVPDLIVEVLSASTASRDRGEKKAVYARNGVREYWLVDWRSRSLTIFTLAETGYDLGKRFEENDTVASTVLRGLEFRPADLFA